MRASLFSIALTCAVALPATAFSQAPPAAPQLAATEADYVTKDFHFKSGETLPELKLHYTTFGKIHRNAAGHVDNAVLVMHGTGGTGKYFDSPGFGGELFGPGQPLDATKYFIVMPDGIGHGGSSKPSDGMRAHFPKYCYHDMVTADYQLLTEHLGVKHLRLAMGTSMGAMHSWVWGEMYPDFMDALMPMACLPVQIAGRNRIWRKMVMDGIRTDPEWKNGDYTTQPPQGIRIALDFLIIAGSAPIPMQKQFPTRDDADKWLDNYFRTRTSGLDANDFLYQVNASRNYDPSPNLEKITVPVMWMNSADDFINPPDLGIAEQQVKRLKNGKFVLIPASEQTHGHGTHTFAAIWKQNMAEILAKSAR